MIDPFTQVYDALWVLVERNNALQMYLQPRNKIKYDEPNEPKPNIGDGDLPELALLDSTINFNTVPTDCSNESLAKDYVWAITTGTYQIQPLFNELTFELYRSMIDWESSLMQLEWYDCKFVHRCRLQSGDSGTLMRDIDRGVSGWSALWTVKVDFVFPRNKLRIKV